MDKDKMIDRIMREYEKNGEPVTREEAAEIAEMEIKAKQCGRRYEGDTTARKKASTKRPLDAEKVEIIKSIYKNLSRCVFDDDREITNIHIKNAQKEITFNIKGAEYSISLIKHKNKK